MLTPWLKPHECRAGATISVYSARWRAEVLGEALGLGPRSSQCPDAPLPSDHARRQPPTRLVCSLARAPLGQERDGETPHCHRASPQCRPRQPLASSFLYVTTASSPRERLCDCGTSEGCRNVPRTAFSEDRGAGGPLALLQLASRTGGAESTGWGPKTQAQIVPSWKGPVWKVCPVPHDTDLARLAL